VLEEIRTGERTEDSDTGLLLLADGLDALKAVKLFLTAPAKK